MENKYNPLSDCRFYKGEESYPESLNQIDIRAALFWRGERLYVEAVEDPSMIHDIELFYKNCGLEGADYTISHLLKACIFSELCRHSDIDPLEDALFFRETILPKYLSLYR